jgi:hypothetical protein
MRILLFITIGTLYCHIMFGDERRHHKGRERIDKIVHGYSPSTIYEWHRVDDVYQKISNAFNNLAPEFKALSVATGECRAVADQTQLAIFYNGLVSS